MKEINEEENFINFNFDISAYRLLGRELITDRVTALFEIVKNSYDANSKNVSISFVEDKSKNISKIVIEDDGLGMDFSDIKSSWMVIGTSSKRRERVSPPPCERKVSGKKGIGRFAVDLLGSKLTLKSKKKNSEKWVYLITDWSYYSKLEDKQLELPFEESKKDYFTDVKNKYWFEKGDKGVQGTILEIEYVNEIWTEYDVSRISKQLSKLVSPFITPNCPFNIKIYSPFKKLNNIKVKPLSLQKYSSNSIVLSYDKENNTQEIIRFEDGSFVKINVPKLSFGLINFKLYYFNQRAKNKFKKEFQTEIDGFKIYRDGLITTPFAEHEADQNKQKDILGIDKRRYSGFFDKLSSRDILGFVEITDENNPLIVETTNRQDFIDNKAYRDLKVFIIEQIEQLEKSFKHDRKIAKEKTTSNLINANYDIKSIKKALTNIKETSEDSAVKNQISEVQKGLNKLQGTINKNLKDYNELEEEIKQKEDLFFSLVSLQTYAAMFSHMTKHTIGHVIRDAEYFNKYFPNEKLSLRFKKISNRIYSEFLTLRTGVDFMLKYAKSETEVEDINFKELISNQFNIYENLFKKENINTELDLTGNLVLRYNKKVLQDIFDNLISNSIKALKNRKNKVIKCSSISDNKELTIFFSDNGIGIEEQDKYRVFDIFFTKTAEDGGAGIGLYMVKTRIEAMNGTITLVENEFKPSGATFKIVLPFNK